MSESRNIEFELLNQTVSARVEFNYEAGEEQSDDCPGCPEEFELVKLEVLLDSEWTDVGGFLKSPEICEEIVELIKESEDEN